jgi:NAD(P)-dependent dehydrogenase (short-subunit alcohol dehydrogenase family)
VPGNIVNLIDQKVLNLTPYYLSYTAAKAGLWALTRTLAQELAPRIRVNAIGPGPTLPNKTQSADEFAAYAASMPLGRGTTPEEIAAAVAYILATPSLTGHLIPLDGGEHLGWAHPRRRGG